MTQPYRKKLIEVALPLKAINEAAAREKSIRHGHPSTLHLWWARRPLAACRAVLFASFVDDPESDPIFRRPDGSVDEDRAAIKRAQLFNLIDELVQWENSNNPRVINSARAEIARCLASNKIERGQITKDTVIYGDHNGQKHPKGATPGDGTTAWEVLLMKATPEIVNAFLAEHAPPVLDPFAGGGSIPLEAQRLGLRAFASDLNPIPVLVNKALIEIPAKFAGLPPVNPNWHAESDAKKLTTVWQGAQGLADDVRYYGEWMRTEAEKQLGKLYPKVKITDDLAARRPSLAKYVGQELTVIAWLWARSIKSPNPAAGNARTPLVKSFWLSKRKGKHAWIAPVVDRATNSIAYRIVEQDGSPEIVGTVNRKGATCLLTGDHIPFDVIRAAGKSGDISFELIGIAAEGDRERVYLPPVQSHSAIASDAQPSWVPDSEIPYNPFSLRPPLYGFHRFSDLFTLRQLSILSTLTILVDEARKRVLDRLSSPACKALTTAKEDYARAVALYLALSVDKLADLGNTGCLWEPVAQCPRNLFGRQAMPMHWSFAEANPFSDSSGSYKVVIDNLHRNLVAILSQPVPVQLGTVRQLDVTALAKFEVPPVICTDPPYYNNVDYADLSDFFYVWLRQSLKKAYPDEVSTLLTPKERELVATPYRFSGDKNAAKEFFESGLKKALRQIREVHDSHYPFALFYAFKQAEADDEVDGDADLAPDDVIASTGWETMLEAIMSTGFAVTGTWPLRTELTAALKANMNALASSIVVVCHPRSTDATLATRKQFMAHLRAELPTALRNLQHGNIAPVDLAQAAIGPGMAIYTRFAKVIESDGRPMSIRTALGIINQVLDEVLAEQEGDFDPDTRWALAWFEQHGVDEGPFGIAETLSKAKNTAINGLVEAGVVKAKAGKVQLVSRAELLDEWNPTTDKRLTVWETTQHLIRTLETKGEAEAANLLNSLGGIGETARELAYRLYSICERKKWADQALAYNSLVIAWPELSKLALSNRNRQTSSQQELFT